LCSIKYPKPQAYHVLENQRERVRESGRVSERWGEREREKERESERERERVKEKMSSAMQHLGCRGGRATERAACGRAEAGFRVKVDRKGFRVFGI